MKYYRNSCILLDQNPDHITLPRETNDLYSKSSLEHIWKPNADLANDKRIDKAKVTITRIVPANSEWNNKACFVNDQLKKMFKTTGTEKHFRLFLDLWSDIKIPKTSTSSVFLVSFYVFDFSLVSANFDFPTKMKYLQWNTNTLNHY